MKSECFIAGQISIFDLPVIEIVKPKKIMIKEENKEIGNKFDNIIKLYSHSCRRIVKTLSRELLVEFDDKTLYFNSKGINEFNRPINVGIMSGEEIVIVNQDK
ncbi:hypothetical protein CDLVIII_0838 [Clostridium sp. DL-VIII]|uniref:hypothetical protein n=1 Tax=Clostridium sp. DL-VIII TaxID=641107 RepID=UPI00023AF10B|nr:hypothetical protein [Clostridium sp. DL-VIII]EHI97563.1 hypothetical protein CDLVIII_0838 [Clostridium sp. DL-VIII]